ncbi:MAG: hypothetical protein NVV70_17110 [Cellulomonas sp.]|nr:hypothetical protein [Cellulomonas sp.]MCR6649767.1 hypothetical protein [Cellulomonas sp.]
MSAHAETAFALCLCDDGAHDDVDLAGWHSTRDRADRDRTYYPAQPGHIVRMDTTVKKEVAA